MKKNTNKDIADYYDQTLNHYQKWWHLDQSLAVHYGFWDKDTKNFKDALENTNRFLLTMADIEINAKVLDAGCGVGGSCFYIARKNQSETLGISLSKRQIDYAKKKVDELKLKDKVKFKIEDYTNTEFEPETFDLIWAIESITSAPDKAKFAQEAYRILKPGGKLIIADYFKTYNADEMPEVMEKWINNWSMSPFLNVDEYVEIFEKHQLKLTKQEDVTGMIRKTSKIMYKASLLGSLPSMLYNLFNDTSKFAKNHYKSGYYQYKALKKELWQYHVLLFQKANT